MSIRRKFLVGEAVVISQKGRRAFRGRCGIVADYSGWDKDDYCIEFTDGFLPSIEYFKAAELRRPESPTECVDPDNGALTAS